MTSSQNSHRRSDRRRLNFSRWQEERAANLLARSRARADTATRRAFDSVIDGTDAETIRANRAADLQ